MLRVVGELEGSHECRALGHAAGPRAFCDIGKQLPGDAQFGGIILLRGNPLQLPASSVRSGRWQTVPLQPSSCHGTRIEMCRSGYFLVDMA